MMANVLFWDQPMSALEERWRREVANAKDAWRNHDTRANRDAYYEAIRRTHLEYIARRYGVTV